MAEAKVKGAGKAAEAKESKEAAANKKADYVSGVEQKVDAVAVDLVSRIVRWVQETDNRVLEDYEPDHDDTKEATDAYKAIKADIEKRRLQIPRDQEIARDALNVLAQIIKIYRIDMIDDFYIHSMTSSFALEPLLSLFVHELRHASERHAYFSNLREEFDKLRKEQGSIANRVEQVRKVLFDDAHFTPQISSTQEEVIGLLQADVQDVKKRLEGVEKVAADNVRQIGRDLRNLVTTQQNLELFMGFDAITDSMISEKKVRHVEVTGEKKVDLSPEGVRINQLRDWFMSRAVEPEIIDAQEMEILISRLYNLVSADNPFKKSLAELQQRILSYNHKNEEMLSIEKKATEIFKLYCGLLDYEQQRRARTKSADEFLLKVLGESKLITRVADRTPRVVAAPNLFALLEFAEGHTNISEFPADRLLQELLRSREDRFSRLKTCLENICKTKKTFVQASEGDAGDTLLTRKSRLISAYEQSLKEYFVEANRVFANDPAYQKFKKDRQVRQAASGPQSQT